MEIDKIREGANKHKQVTRIDSLAQEYMNVQDGNATDVAKELKDTCDMSVVNAIGAYLHATGGLEKYAEAFDKADDDDEYRATCRETTDTKSVEYVIGKALNGNVSVVGNIIARVVGSKVGFVGKQIKALWRDMLGSGVWTKDSDNYELMSILAPQMYAKKYPYIFEHDELLNRVYDIVIESIKLGKVAKED